MYLLFKKISFMSLSLMSIEKNIDIVKLELKSCLCEFTRIFTILQKKQLLIILFFLNDLIILLI